MPYKKPSKNTQRMFFSCILLKGYTVNIKEKGSSVFELKMKSTVDKLITLYTHLSGREATEMITADVLEMYEQTGISVKSTEPCIINAIFASIPSHQMEKYYGFSYKTFRASYYDSFENDPVDERAAYDALLEVAKWANDAYSITKPISDPLVYKKAKKVKKPKKKLSAEELKEKQEENREKQKALREKKKKARDRLAKRKYTPTGNAPWMANLSEETKEKMRLAREAREREGK